MTLIIKEDTPDGPETLELLERHLTLMHEVSPPESIHALEVDELRAPEVTFWTGWCEGMLLGCGALKEIDAKHGEIKSMHTATAARGQGVGAAMLKHILSEARRRHYRRLSLETGSQEAFRPARALYERHGFTYCAPFADYDEDPASVFMTLEL